jgi:peptide deformylase
MAILPILAYPHPLLKTVCSPVESLDSETLQFIKDLEETLESSPGCVGIAAPQVSMLKRIIIVDASRNRKPVENHGRLVLINPVVEWQDGEVLGREGCLSLPHLTANVKRAKHIRCRALTAHGNDLKELTVEASEFEARVILHESDHLDGLLFLDRVSSLKTDVFRRKTY